MDTPCASAARCYKKVSMWGRVVGSRAIDRSMRTSTLLGVTTAGALALVASAAWGHAELTQPAARPGTQIKMGPCGGVAPGNPTFVFAKDAGAKMPVQWVEMIDHEGCFVFDIAKAGDDQNFQTVKVVPDDAGTATPHTYSTNINIPADGGLDCQFCTLRLRQFMGANPATCNANTTPSQGYYYSCADIQIGDWPTAVRPDSGTPAGGDGGTTTGTDGGTGTGSSGGSSSGGAVTPDGGPSGFDDTGDGLPKNDSGCTTSPVGATSGFTGMVAIAALALVRARRRRK